MSSISGERPAQSGSLGYAPLVSGEAVQIDLRVARIGSRAVAATLDFALQLIVLAFVSALIANLINLDTAALAAAEIVSLVVIFIGYPVVSEAAFDGRTLGKAAMGLRAAREDGGPLRFRQALVRGLTGAFIEKPGISLGLVAVVCSMFSFRGKRLGDLLCGSVVLQVRLPASGAYVPPMPPPLASWATTLDLSRFNDALALQCRQFLGRAGQLAPEARERLGASLVAAVQSALATEPPPGTPGWAFLSAVLAERRRREEQRMYAGAYPQPGYPQTGYPQPGYPQTGHPPQPGYPPQAPYAQPGYEYPQPGPPPNADVPGPFAPPS